MDGRTTAPRRYQHRVPYPVSGPGVPGLVSVVIPAYNAAAYIGAALESVFRQTYPHHETIVVNDGSTDATEGALAPWRDRITYLRQPNGGAAVARNNGLAAARGEYIAFLDADDLWTPEKLERQVAYLQRHPDIVLVHTDMYLMRDGAVHLYPSKRGLQPTDGPNLPVIFAYTHVMTPMAMARRSVLEVVGGFDARMTPSEDYDLWIRMAREGGVGLIQEPLTQVRVTPGSYSRTDRSRTFASILRVLECAVAEDPEFVRAYPQVVRRRLALAHHELGLHLLRRGDRGEARRHLTRALTENPRLIPSYLHWLATFVPAGALAGLQGLKRRLLPWDLFERSTRWDSVDVRRWAGEGRAGSGEGTERRFHRSTVQWRERPSKVRRFGCPRGGDGH